MNGKTMLANSRIPNEFYRLFTSQDEIGKTFRQNIRAYNTNFSFTSMGVTLDDTMTNMRDGVYTFRAHKGIYHKIDQLVPRDGTPRYLQLYFYDPDTELDHRLKWPNLDRNITETLARVLSTNPYVRTFRSLAELGPLDNYKVTLNASVELDQRVYNRPTTSEVAGIWVEGNDNITAYKRSIVVYGRSEYSETIQPYFGCYDPLSYPLFFPNGESGWHPNIPCEGVSINEVHNDHVNFDEDIKEANPQGNRTTVAMREYYCYKFQIRSMENVLLLGGRLLQQFVVDVYIKLETSRLKFYERNQSRIRADLYQGIVDCVHLGEVHPNRVGQRVVLPASFIGGPRDMRRRFLDAMALVQDDGKPDLFLTLTCNPQWPEICDNLKPGQTAQDRPELVSRIFRAKLEDLKEQLFKKHLLGEDEAARQYLYKDFPKYFTWKDSSRSWNRRIVRPQRGRIVSANPAEGERYYLRILLSNIKGPTSFEDLCTVNGEKYTTFRRAALEIGLIENDDSLSQCLTEASLFQFPNALRRLFETIMIFCEPGDIRKLWNEHFDALSEDHRFYYQSVERIRNMNTTYNMQFIVRYKKSMG
ncbi:hypothetical protein M8C21_015503 [Ambrosia artemisiifolia]|uniref:Helitron helicase-like domain-containing protein n=1 Tax=Ambrosia artemisiifolia TaxID=4212 RepID=A0AAD5DAK4_AMBAR|nr:hypothetical protein M8C21_015503 [Ambrosia artemisiifolia]